ncbi:MAG: hypothetical protein CM1200mP30_01560 [Pseudomonadota bacterium]|nr:MAG: hypothetical protein CM1200mP30_01560 [Pseudomonadota bacterium]
MVNGSEVMEGQWGTGIEKKPIHVTSVLGKKKGDMVNLKLLDNKNKNFFLWKQNLNNSANGTHSYKWKKK